MEEKDLLEVINKLRTARRESKTIDAKQELALQSLGEKAEFVKDMLAMANNGEKSYLVIGLQDGTFADIGLLNHHYVKNDLNQILVDKTDPPVIVDYQEFTLNGNEYGLVEIIGTNLPYIAARNLVPDRADRKQTRVYKGTIFVRHDDRTEGAGRVELEELLKRRGIKKEFENETEYAQQLVFDRPYGWEYLLTAELLRSKLEPIKRNFTELQRGLVYRRSTPLPGFEFMHWSRSKCDDLANIIGVASHVFNEEIPASWGLPGIAGDPLEIKRAVEKIVAVCNHLLEWETDVRFTAPADPFITLKQKMAGWTSELIDEVDSAPDKIGAPFKQPNPTGEYSIILVFNAPSGLDDFMIEMQRLQNNPQELMALYF